MADKQTDNLTTEILSELWENAVFNDKAKDLVEKILAEQAKQAEPTDKKAISLPMQEAHGILSTIRNRNLINDDQQKKLRETVVGFWGLSVGSNAALAWMLESRAETVKIIDPDIISPSNLNRLQFGWDSIGSLKVDCVKEKLLVVNPYAAVITSIETTKESTEKLFDETPKLDIVVDEMDDLVGKITLRTFARARKLPVIMCTDIGDNVCIDIERYDTDPQPEMFLGRIPGIENIDLSQLSYLERLKLIITIVGFEHNSEAMLDSLLSIGKSVATWPQLAATAFITGGATATTIKKIVLGEEVKSGRYYISLDDLLVSDFNTKENVSKRNEKIATAKKRFKLQ